MKMNRAAGVALIAVAIGFGVAGYAIARYEAWWTIAFGVAGAGVVLAAAGRSASQALAIGAGYAGSLTAAMLGAFVTYMGLTYRGAACLPEECVNRGPVLLLAGIGLLAAALAVLALTRWYSRRSLRR